jgi:hypothetical protein
MDEDDGDVGDGEVGVAAGGADAEHSTLAVLDSALEEELALKVRAYLPPYLIPN